MRPANSARAICLAALVSTPVRAATPACRLPGRPTLAVLDPSAAGALAPMRSLLGDALRADVVQTECFRVQDRAQMREILAAGGAKADSCDASCATDAGRLLQVRYLLFVKAYAVGAGAFAVATLTDVEKGTSVASAQVPSPSVAPDALLALARQVAAGIAYDVPAPAAPPEGEQPAAPLRCEQGFVPGVGVCVKSEPYFEKKLELCDRGDASRAAAQRYDEALLQRLSAGKPLP